MNNVTVVLITWKRQFNIPKIVEHLLKYDFIDEILIRDNSKCENIINYGRYVLAEKAKNSIIYTQDDDCIVQNLQAIYDKFCEDPHRISHGGTEGYLKVIPDNIYGHTQMCLAGWGNFFRKEWIPVLKKYTKKYGKDKCFYRETDRLFSLLLNRKHNVLNGNIKHLKGKDDKDALCKQDDHIKYKKLAIERHHKDYDKSLKVIFVCNECHGKLDKFGGKLIW